MLLLYQQRQLCLTDNPSQLTLVPGVAPCPNGNVYDAPVFRLYAVPVTLFSAAVTFVVAPVPTNTITFAGIKFDYRLTTSAAATSLTAKSFKLKPVAAIPVSRARVEEPLII